MKSNYLTCMLGFCAAVAASIADAETPPESKANKVSLQDECLLHAIKSAKKTQTIEEIRAKCRPSEVDGIKLGAISKRIVSERQQEFDPYVITPHKMNYLLPVIATDSPNKQAYDDFGNWSEHLTNYEAKFQLSLKVPLLTDDLLVKGDALYFGFTMQSWWQVYSSNISKPFRETNYQPEVFYLAPLKWHPFGGNTGLMIGAEHQSNGRANVLSRSWNRVYLSFLYETEHFGLFFKPWYRLPEEEKLPGTDKGDDNPDIHEYMGHFELGIVHKWDDYEISFIGRQNFAEHHGGLELGFTFPIWGRLRGYLQYTAGYGESLIDYNHNQQRLGIGFALTNIL